MFFNLNGWPRVWYVLNSRSRSTNTRLFRILYIIVTLASFIRCLNIGHLNILETDEYLEKSFNTNFGTLLWTISSLEILCSVDWGPHRWSVFKNRSFHWHITCFLDCIYCDSLLSIFVKRWGLHKRLGLQTCSPKQQHITRYKTTACIRYNTD